jgi:hypothetical protein
MRDQAIRNTHATVCTINAERDAWDKDGNVVVLDESKITTEIARLQAEYTANQYQRDRQYPSIGDQLDMQYHDELNGTTTWKDAVAKVKADNPKPE